MTFATYVVLKILADTIIMSLAISIDRHSVTNGQFGIRLYIPACRPSITASSFSRNFCTLGDKSTWIAHSGIIVVIIILLIKPYFMSV